MSDTTASAAHQVTPAELSELVQSCAARSNGTHAYWDQQIRHAFNRRLFDGMTWEEVRDLFRTCALNNINPLAVMDVARPNA